MNQNSSSPSHWQAAKKIGSTDQLSVISEWVAPIIAWIAVITLTLAVAGLLSGEE